MTFNGVEIVMVFCEKCGAMEILQEGQLHINWEYCNCERVNNRYGHKRIILETKGTMLIKKREMYDAEYNSEDDDEDSDDNYEEYNNKKEEEEEEEGKKEK